MKKIFLLVLLVLGFSMTGSAQEKTKYEASIGFSNLDERGGFFPNRPGWYSTFAANVNDWLAIEGEISGRYGSGDKTNQVFVFSSSIHFSGYDYLIMGGPRFSYRKYNRITPYSHLLLGLDTEHSHILSTGEALFINSIAEKNLFAVTVGGGLDIRVTDNFGFKLVQADYIHTGKNLEGTQNAVRLSTGLIFRWGGK